MIIVILQDGQMWTKMHLSWSYLCTKGRNCSLQLWKITIFLRSFVQAHAHSLHSRSPKGSFFHVILTLARLGKCTMKITYSHRNAKPLQNSGQFQVFHRKTLETSKTYIKSLETWNIEDLKRCFIEGALEGGLGVIESCATYMKLCQAMMHAYALWLES